MVRVMRVVLGGLTFGWGLGLVAVLAESRSHLDGVPLAADLAIGVLALAFAGLAGYGGWLFTREEKSGQTRAARRDSRIDTGGLPGGHHRDAVWVLDHPRTKADEAAVE